MNLQYFKAGFQGKRGENYVFCLRLKSLFVCGSKTNDPSNPEWPILHAMNPTADYWGSSHLVYEKPDFIDELRKNGYDVQESEIPLPIDEDVFNELDFSRCEDGEYKFMFYVFQNLAIRVGIEGIEVFYQSGLTLSDVEAHWKCTVDKSSLAVVCKVPQDAFHALTVKVVHYVYLCWDFYRYPGETFDVEELMDGLTTIYDRLSGGEDLHDMFEPQIEMLTEYAEDINAPLYNKAKELLSALKLLQNECKSAVAISETTVENGASPLDGVVLD